MRTAHNHPGTPRPELFGKCPSLPPPPTPDQRDHRGKQRNLQSGNSCRAIFGTHIFGSQPPPPQHPLSAKPWGPPIPLDPRIMPCKPLGKSRLHRCSLPERCGGAAPRQRALYPGTEAQCCADPSMCEGEAATGGQHRGFGGSSRAVRSRWAPPTARRAAASQAHRPGPPGPGRWPKVQFVEQRLNNGPCWYQAFA